MALRMLRRREPAQEVDVRLEGLVVVVLVGQADVGLEPGALPRLQGEGAGRVASVGVPGLAAAG
eukprot:10014067-Lingulodinium_polyedra.AAC.1